MILKNIERLQIPEELVTYKNVLLAIRSLHLVCNSQVLPHNYTEVIDKFSSSWFQLKQKFNISTTPKVHIILDHLEDYFIETDLILIKTTDEIVESIHQAVFKCLMKGYNVKDISDPNHGNKLMDLVWRINTYNLDIL